MDKNYLTVTAGYGATSDITQVTPATESESLMNLVRELSQECAYLADILVGSVPEKSGSELKSVPSSGLFGEISYNNSESQRLARDAKSHIARIRNAIGK